MGGFCCRCVKRKPSDLPEKYEEKRSFTDITCTVLFIIVWVGFILLGIVAIQKGNFNGLYQVDYLGYQCGGDKKPANFSDFIPDGAPFQSKLWEENKFLWYPLPLIEKATDFLQMSNYLHLGACVKKCPKANIAGLAELLERRKDYKNKTKSITASNLDIMRVYSYGNVTTLNNQVPAASVMYALYDTSEMLWKCLPDLNQPEEVRSYLSRPILEKAYSFLVQGLHELKNSWKVFLIEIGICILLCFVFILLLRFCINVVVWVLIFAVFLLFFGGGLISFYMYYTKGQGAYFSVVGVQDYAIAFLVVAVVLWCLSLFYLLAILSLCYKIRLVCSLLKITSHVLFAAPIFILSLPLVACVLILCVFAWCVVVGICMYSSYDFTVEDALVPITEAFQFYAANRVGSADIPLPLRQSDGGEGGVQSGGESFYKIKSFVLNQDKQFSLFIILDVFAFFWTSNFFLAACFTIIAFISIFWYFSSLVSSEKRINCDDLRRAVFWTLFYHAGTLIFGSFTISIIQTLRLLMNFFYKKLKNILAENNRDIMRCLMCYFNCFLYYFERVFSFINKHVYLVMCLTSKNFSLSTYHAVSFITKYTVEIVFIGWFLDVFIFLGELGIVVGCCSSAFFLLRVEELASDVKVCILPLIVVGAVSFLLSRTFFTVYRSTTSCLLVCYCYDRKINESRGFYYVPEELENQIQDYSQKEKLRRYNNQQTGLHQDEA